MEQEYINLYTAHRELIDSHSADALNKHREAAFERFKTLGFPTKKDENYLYTDLQEPCSVDYGLNLRDVKIETKNKEIFNCHVSGIDSYLYFVLNGRVYPSNKSAQENKLPKGCFIGSLKEAEQTHPDLVAKHLCKLSKQKEDGLIAFNGAFAQNGFFVYVPKGQELEKPIQIVNMLDSTHNLMVHSHNLVILEENAKAQVLVCDHAIGDVNYLASRVSEVFVGKNARYEQYKLEHTSKKNSNLSTLLIEQEENSQALANIITLHNGLTRNTIDIQINGEHCETELCGLSLSSGEQKVDNLSSIFHNKPNCHSNELFKYILDDKAYCGFTGKLFVAQDAQKTMAYQTNRNLLLTSDARMCTRPQLEIYADDVKCSHGATIGQLDKEALFYLRSRGIPAHEARLLLMFAFVDDVVENIHIEPLKERIRLLVEKRLRGEIDSCKGCDIS